MSTTRIRFFLFIGTVIVILATVLLFASNQKKNEKPITVTTCNVLSKEHRFSCYRAFLENQYQNSALALNDFLAQFQKFDDTAFKAEDTSYAIFGTNCHTFYHALGDFIGTHTNEPVEDSIKYCPLSCTSGCTMGLFKRTSIAHNFSLDVLKSFRGVCRKKELNQCSHEIGHILHDKYTGSILETLDRITAEEFGYTYPVDYKYTTFSEANLDKPFEECKQIFADDENLTRQCYTGVGHNLFLYSEFSPTGVRQQFDECMNVKDENRDDCYGFLLFRIGIQDGATKFLSKKVEEGIKVCQDSTTSIAREDLLFHCYRGIGGGIGLYIDSEYLESSVTKDNIEKIRKEVLEFASLCSSEEEEFSEECFAGLLGTRFKGFYQSLELKYEPIERLLPKLKDAFQVVG